MYIPLCNLDNISAVSLPARDGGACAIGPGLVAEQGGRRCELPQTMRIHGVREREKRNKRGPMQTSNKRGCKLSVLCDVANAKCDMQVQMRRRCRSPSSFYASANVKAMPFPIFLLPSPSSSSPLSVHLSAWCPPLSARYLHPFTPALLSLSARRCPSVTPLLVVWLLISSAYY